MEHNKLYFLIPAYNEAQVIGSVIENLIQNHQTNIIVVNDASTDRTEEVVLNFDNVILITHLINRGQGASIATGLDYLSKIKNCNFIVTYDADGQHQLKDVLGMLTLLQQNSELDLVIGSRFMENTETNAPTIRKIVLRLGVLFLRFIYGLKITDAHNGLRVLKNKISSKMIPKLDGFSHASEMIYLIKKNNLKFVEYPTNIIYSEYSISKGQSSLNSIKIALKTILHKIDILFFEKV